MVMPNDTRKDSHGRGIVMEISADFASGFFFGVTVAVTLFMVACANW